jgi:hypothetical protein
MFGIITLVAVGVLVWFGFDAFKGRRRPSVSVSDDGVRVSVRRATLCVNWAEIRQIDLLSQAAGRFGVVLFGNTALEVWNGYRGFEKFAAAMLKRWPAVEPEWKRIASASSGERATVWEQK